MGTSEGRVVRGEEGVGMCVSVGAVGNRVVGGGETCEGAESKSARKMTRRVHDLPHQRWGRHGSGGGGERERGRRELWVCVGGRPTGREVSTEGWHEGRAILRRGRNMHMYSILVTL